MFNPKTEIFEALNSLGYYCRQGGQAVFAETPAITFRISNHTGDIDLSGELGREDITATVDIFANDSPTTSDILSQVESKMRSIGYKLSFSADIPAPEGTLYHINCRFDTVR